MRKSIVIILTVLLVTALLCSGCNTIIRTSDNREPGSGNTETKEFDFSDFTEVDIGSAFDFEIVRSDTYSVTITADDNVFEHLRITQSGGTLNIGLEPFINFGRLNLKANITMPRLNGLDASGATRGTVSGFSSGENLELSVSGASRVEMIEVTTGDIDGEISGASTLKGILNGGEMDIQVSGASTVNIDSVADDVALEVDGASTVKGSLAGGDVNVDLSGASTVELTGTGGDLRIDASGASHVRLGEFAVNNADIIFSGASSGAVDCSGTMDIDVSGASRLSYSGEPSLGSIEVSGGSSIDRKDD